MNILKISLKNIFRNKRRTTTTLAALICGNVAIIIFGGYLEYSFWGLRESTIRSSLGHIQIYKEGYLKAGATDVLGNNISDYGKMKSIMEKELINPETGKSYIKVITPQLLFNGIIGTDERSSICNIKGVEQDQDGILSPMDAVKVGKNLSSEAPHGGVVGQGVADGLKAKVNDYLTLLISTREGGLNAIDFDLRGIFQSRIKAYDDHIVKIPIQLAQEILGTKDITKIMILLDKTENTDIVRKKILALKDKYKWKIELRTWYQLATFYKQAYKLQYAIYNFIKLIIALIVIFSIANTISMSVMERTREIGTIRALGGNRGYVTKLFLLEGLWIGAIGGILGIIIAIIISKIININGIQMPPPPGQTKGYIAYIRIVNDLLIFSFLLSFFTAFISSILPAFRAARLKVNDALRSI